MLVRSSIAALVAAVAFCGCEESAEPISSVSLPVLGGRADTTHEQVVSIATLPGAPVPQLCTGVVVGPRVVLTAGHCVRDQSPVTLQVGFGPSASAPTRSVAISAVDVVPRFTGDLTVDKPRGHDLGVVLLAEDAGVTPIAITHAAPAPGNVVQLVGFGLSSATDVETRGTRRIADVTLGASCPLLVAFGDDATNACHGDSGAPLLRARSDGTEEVVGIVSYGRTASCDPPSYAVRVDAYAAWIENVVAGNSPTDCVKCPPEATDCPPGEAPDASDDGATVEIPDAADASSASQVTVGGGGCEWKVARRDRNAPPLGILAALALAWRVRRRRGNAPRTEDQRPHLRT